MTEHTENRGYIPPKKGVPPIYIALFLMAVFGFIGWSLYSESQIHDQMLGEVSGPLRGVEIIDESAFIINTITDPVLVKGFQGALQSSDTQRAMRTSENVVTLTIRGLDPSFDHVLGRDGKEVTIRLLRDEPMDLSRCRLHGDFTGELHCSYELADGSVGKLSSRALHDWLKAIPNTLEDPPTDEE